MALLLDAMGPDRKLFMIGFERVDVEKSMNLWESIIRPTDAARTKAGIAARAPFALYDEQTHELTQAAPEPSLADLMEADADYQAAAKIEARRIEVEGRYGLRFRRPSMRKVASMRGARCFQGD